jgi:hypothetical protein
MTSPEGKPVLMDLISAIIRRPAIDVVVRNNELPLGDTKGNLRKPHIMFFIRVKPA